MLLQVILLIVIFIILLFVVFFSYLYLSTRKVIIKGKKVVENIDSTSPYRKAEPTRKPHNLLYAKIKNKEIEKEALDAASNKQHFGQIQRYNEKGLGGEVEVEKQGDSVEIVGIAEPVGFWSKFVMKQKMKFIMARVNMQQSNDKGFWVNLIKAQSMSQGKDQSRGR